MFVALSAGVCVQVTNPKRVARAIEEKTCNALLLKVNQIPQHGVQPDTMALITSDCDAMRSPSLKWP